LDERITVLKPTIAFDTYWEFAAERLAILYRRQNDPIGPWTDDPILSTYRFTNTYRVTDRVSQYLIREIQYGHGRSQEPSEVFFRTMLFKVFNKIETWEYLELKHGPLAWRTANLEAIDHTLTALLATGRSIYSAAYIMPAPPFGHARKHSNHLGLIARMMADKVSNQVARATNLEAVYKTMLGYPGLGPFLAFQYAIDLNYSSLLNFGESDFVVAGPGALDGISKCFSDTDGRSAERIIYWMVERQIDEFARRGLSFPGLFGRPLQPIDCQNVFCEVSKYTRVAHPHLQGRSDRQRIKQNYRRSARPIEALCFPHRWELDTNMAISAPPLVAHSGQRQLF
jgi:hypothetical protein